MLVCICVCMGMCILAPKKVRPLSLLVPGIIGRCKRSDLVSGNEIFFTLQPCLWPYTFLKPLYINLKSGNSEEFIQEKDHFYVNDWIKTLAIIVAISLKEKKIFHFNLEERKLLPCSLKTDGGNNYIVVSILQHLKSILKYAIYGKSTC